MTAAESEFVIPVTAAVAVATDQHWQLLTYIDVEVLDLLVAESTELKN